MAACLPAFAQSLSTTQLRGTTTSPGGSSGASGISGSGSTGGYGGGGGLDQPGTQRPSGLIPADALLPDPLARPTVADARRSGAQPRGRQRLTSKRTRSPTAAAFRGELRGPLEDPRVVPIVQGPQTGIPDPVEPVPAPRKKPKPEEDPYAQLGIRVGNIMLYPSIGESIGYDSNPNRTQGGKGSFVSQTEGELRLQSDWSAHELSGFLRAAYNEYPSVPEARRPEGAGRLQLRLDINRDTTLTSEVHYALDTERFGSPNLSVFARQRPITNSEGGSVALTERFNRLQVTLRGTVDRSDYSNVTLDDGSLLDQRDRAFTTVGGALRVGYELTPGLVPFVEGVGNVRNYDLTTDFSGYRRSSNGFGGNVGSTFELTRLVTGEVSVGAIQRRYDDARLHDLTSPVATGALTWLATPLTTVKLTGQVSVDETTVVGSNGVVTERAGIEIAHQLRRNLTITPSFTVFENDYRGGVGIVEKGFSAAIRAEYKLTRWLALRASYTYEQLRSNYPGNDYTANVMLVGLRYQP